MRHATPLSFLLLSFFVLGCDPFHTAFDATEAPIYFQADTLNSIPDTSDTLSIMTWNIKFGGGRIDFFFDCHGDEVLMTKAETESNLAALATVISDIEPDILFIQEADIASKRSAYINQVQWLLDNTKLNYAVYASQWRADFVPSDGVGPVDSGNAILSRWPIHNAQRIALPEIASQDALTRYFYLKRNYLKAGISPATGKTVNLLNIHTSAFAQDDTGKQQLDIFLDELKQLDADNKNFIAGGDFNTLPPNSVKAKDFPDSVCTDEDFQADDFSDKLDWLSDFYTIFTPAVTLDDYSADNSPYFTHSVSSNELWNRKLDYLFTNSSFVEGTTQVYQNETNGGINTMPLSDHAPMSVQWSIP